MNLRLHSHEFKFPCLWTQDSGCIPMSSYSPANESQDCIPMSSYSPANESLDAWVQVPIPKPMDSRLHSHEFLFPCQILESFGWVPPMSCHPDSGMPLGFHQLRPERDFGCTPYNHTWVPLKSIWERFRALLRDFRFSLGFMRTSDSSMHDVQYLCWLFKNPVVDLLRGWSPSGEVVDGTPDSGMPVESPRMRPERDLRGAPYNHTWVPLKSIVEHFRCLLRDFCFWANFSIFRIEKILIFDALKRIKKTRRLVHNPIASNGHPEWVWNDK